MLHPYRRFLFLLVASVMVAPLIVGVLRPESDPGQPLPAIAFPRRTDDWKWLPWIINAHLARELGLRQAMIGIHSALMEAVPFAPDKIVLVGKGGWLFARVDNMLEQSAGLLLRKSRIAATADTLADVRDVLADMGIPFVFASPPNASTIYPDYVPSWARNRNQAPQFKTEYDEMLDALAERGIRTVDLRPVLHAARSTGSTYRKFDSHWTPLGALAAYNTLVTAINHADWLLEAATVLGPAQPITGGDLADHIGIRATEALESFRPPMVEQRQESGVLLTKSQQLSEGMIAIIGDSFTRDQFSALLTAHVGQVVWIHHQNCRFEWKWINQFHPDEVWWMPTERLMLCEPEARPIGMPILRVEDSHR